MAGQAHAAMVHFPIALAITAFVFHVMALLWRSEAFARTGRYLFVAAAVGALPAIASGFWVLYELGPFGELRVLAHLHRLVGLLTAALLIVSAIWVLTPGRRAQVKPTLGYVVAGLILTGLVVYTAYLGGEVADWGG